MGAIYPWLRRSISQRNRSKFLEVSQCKREGWTCQMSHLLQPMANYHNESHMQKTHANDLPQNDSATWNDYEWFIYSQQSPMSQYNNTSARMRFTYQARNKAHRVQCNTEFQRGYSEWLTVTTLVLGVLLTCAPWLWPGWEQWCPHPPMTIQEIKTVGKKWRKMRQFRLWVHFHFYMAPFQTREPT